MQSHFLVRHLNLIKWPTDKLTAARRARLSFSRAKLETRLEILHTWSARGEGVGVAGGRGAS